jgi:ABC-type sulfate transport system substrate-binding protein
LFKGLSREELVKSVEKWNLLGPWGLALKEQKPKNHKNIEQKPKIKSRNIKRSSQARRNTKHRREKRGLKKKRL